MCRDLAAERVFARVVVSDSKARVVKAPVLGARYLNFRERWLNFRDKPNV